jgi:polyribonucleotide nucleotidyltransferase
MVHISEITGKHLAKIEDAGLKEGDPVFVKYLGVDKRGKTRMSMVGIDQKTGAEIDIPKEKESKRKSKKTEE